MPVHNADIAAVFDEIADLLELQEGNPFRIRAYRGAARVVRDVGRDLGGMVDAGEDLDDLPGIGEDLAGKIREILDSGTCALREELRKETPPALSALLRIPGLGPKRVRRLHDELAIESVDQLADAASAGRIRALSGFGAKTEQSILEALRTRQETSGRIPLAIAAQYAETYVAYLRRAPGVSEVVAAGSYRRGKETVGDLDILATARRGAPVIDHFVAYDEVEKVVSRGTTRATVILRAGMQVDLRVVPQASFGAALHYFTGSKPHNIAIRALGQKAGLKINEYGVFRGARRIAGKTEASVFSSVGLPWIPPELRENHGEIDAAREKRLPRLIELGDLRGDLHAHTTATDGRNTLREMARAAAERGLEYLAITDHSRRVTVAHGLDARRLRAQGKEIDVLNRELEGITLLKAVELDILESGRLDLPDSVLAELDLVVASVHSYFNLSREKQTARVLKAMDNPHVKIIAHPTGRLVLKREPFEIDMERVFRHARESGCALELNAHPERLDLDDVHCRMAKDFGVPISINTDAHSIHDLNNLRFGVCQARRGWLEKADVLNTRSLEDLREFLRPLR